MSTPFDNSINRDDEVAKFNGLAKKAVDHPVDNAATLPPLLRLIKHSDTAITPRPSDYRRADSSRKAWDRWVICAKEELLIHPGMAERVQTGWTVHAYPSDDYSLELRLTEWAARKGLLLTNPSLDTLYGFGTEADIAPIVYNTNTRGIIKITPTDTFFELCLLPKVHFVVATDGKFDDVIR